MQAESKEIIMVAIHYSTPLKNHIFNLDNAIQEFREVKRIVKNRYHHLEAAAMWHSIFSKHRES